MSRRGIGRCNEVGVGGVFSQIGDARVCEDDEDGDDAVREKFTNSK